MNQNSEGITKSVWVYEDIKLYKYFEIAETGNVLLVSKTGKHSLDECTVYWEEIVKRNGEVTGSYDYSTFLDLQNSYADIFSLYNGIKATILKLYIETSPQEIKEDLKWLREQGYKISVGSSKMYADSLDLAWKKCSNMLTRLTVKQNELTSFSEDQESETNLEEVLATVSFFVGFPIKKNVTLARFNEYNKLIKKKFTPKPVEDGRE